MIQKYRDETVPRKRTCRYCREPVTSGRFCDEICLRLHTGKAKAPLIGDIWKGTHPEYKVPLEWLILPPNGNEAMGKSIIVGVPKGDRRKAWFSPVEDIKLMKCLGMSKEVVKLMDDRHIPSKWAR